MRGINFSQQSSAQFAVCALFAVATAVARAQGGGASPFNGHPPILGSASCAASGCHGGAGEKSLQVVIWSQRDVHSRAYATLTTSRAMRMAEALEIKDPVTDPRCTTCHAPLQTVDPKLRAPDAHVTEGVSCVSCHGYGDNWLRSHTRTDFTKADRFATGLRDVNDLAARAGACIACHQNIEPAVVNVGKHPALVFELDGQTHSEPMHWKEKAGFSGAQAWFVGQVVALREVSWALVNHRADPARDGATAQALAWLVQRSGLAADFPSGEAGAATIEAADKLAKNAAKNWSAGQGAVVLGKLAASAEDFRATDKPRLAQAARAERLVLALDRLLAAQPADRRPAAASAQLDKLFKLAQSQPDFAAEDFARELAVFATTLK